MANLNFSPGDEVRLRLAKRMVEGTVLENPDGTILLLKLKTGYNIGIPRENILAGRALKKFKAEKKEEEKIEMVKGKKNVGLVVTGGTIASKLDSRTGGVAPLTEMEEFRKYYPELFEMVNVSRIEIPFMELSENMNSWHWKRIAESVHKILSEEGVSGVIVAHGTDFLHYTSAALSFFLKDLNKPVVLTYSQRSIDRASSDANLNLQCATQFALSDYAGVALVGHANTDDEYCHALSGTKVRKLHSSRRDAFKVVNDMPIAKVWPDRTEFYGEHKTRGKGKTELDLEYNDKVALVKFYPGQDSSILDYYALKYKGIVIEGSGMGHVSASGDKSWIPKLKKHIRDGMVVCMTTQTIFGRVDGYVYRTARKLMDAGVIFLEDMLSETALVKLGWILGHYGWKGKVKEKMLENVVGELNERLGMKFCK
jgi:glutamyl-tRNA(Gln) amidotransferase subunit D